MIQTKTEEHLLEAEFYEKPFSFSYSSLNTLITAPGAFYKEYVLKQKDNEIKKYLLEGILIHYLILEHQGFDERFAVLTEDLPSENSKLVVDRIYQEHFLDRNDDSLRLADFENEIDNILSEINLHQSTKDKDKRLAKIIDFKNEEYFKFLKSKQNKTLIDTKLLDESTIRADIAKNNKQIRQLLGMDLISDGRTIGVYNELHIVMNPGELHLPFGLHGHLDNVVVDVRQKLIRINDFKTTSKTLADFQESVEFWNYWLQAAVYLKLAKQFFRSILKNDWKIEFRFIVFDKYNQLYPFLVTDGTMEQWTESFEQTVLKEALYHYESKDFSLPYDFAMGNIKL